MNRGSSIGETPRATRDNCFNEAPIHESGKCRDPGRNGRGGAAASMRPRFMNRGSADGLGDRFDDVVQLQ